MAYGAILGQTTPAMPGVGAAIISGVVNNGETINAGDVVDLVDTSTLLSAVTPGTLVKLKENGAPQEFYVAKHGYPTNGNGRTLLVRRYIYDTRQWHTSDVNAYASCALDSWFNNTYYNLLDADIKAQIAAVAIPYTPGNGNNSVTTLSRKVFALSVTELGRTASYANVEGSALPIASTLQIARNSYGSTVVQWTRSPNTDHASYACCLGTDGNVYNYYRCTNTGGARPAFTLPSSLYVLDDGTVSQTKPQPTGTVFTKQNTPYQAIALSSGTSGQTIQVIYSGITNASWVTAGQTITSTATGVQGYGVKDGILEVFPYYRPQ